MCPEKKHGEIYPWNFQAPAFNQSPTDDINVQATLSCNTLGQTPLHAAAEAGHLQARQDPGGI